jgi:hypothetical protein
MDRVADASAGSDRLYTIKPILGKGQGFIATSKILKSTRILSEAPVFKVPRFATNTRSLESIIIKELISLSRNQQRAFFALHNAYGRSHSSFLGISRTNVLPLGSGASEESVFLEASRINHSCRHNAQNTWNSNIERLTIHTLRDIEGQEITITYLSSSPDYAERQRDLKEKPCFDCECEVCSLPLAQREGSDLRLNKIRFVDEAIGDLDETVTDPETGLHVIHMMFRCLKRRAFGMQES